MSLAVRRTGSPPVPRVAGPVRGLATSTYEKVASTLISMLILLGAVTFCLFVAWLGTRMLGSFQPIPVDYIQQVGGGTLDGVVGESMQLDAPEFREIAAESEIVEDQFEQTVEQVLDALAERQADLSDPALTEQFEGRGGSKMIGTGNRPAYGYGSGLPGLPPHMRWEVRFPEGNTLEAYARILGYFGIELGVLGENNQVFLLTQLGRGNGVRVNKPRAEEQRMYMTWRHGSLKEADRQLLERAGIPVGNKIILHFYPPELEQHLLQLERAYAGRDAGRIRKTRFQIRKTGNGYEFVVIDQTPL